MVKDIAFSLSLANLCFLWPWNLLLSKTSLYFYKNPPARWDYLAILIDMLGLGIAIFIAVAVVRKIRSQMLLRMIVVFYLAILAIPALSIRKYFPFFTKSILGHVGSKGLLLLCGGIGAVILVLVLVNPRKFVKVTTVLILSLFPLFVLNLSQACYYLVNGPGSYAESGNEKKSRISDDRIGRKIILMIFDEMDFRLSFLERPRNIELPELERFSRVGVFASHAYPPSSSTLSSIPAMLTGKLLSSASPKHQSDLAISTPENEPRKSLSESNLFKDLGKAGVSSAVVGFYHPYCRMFAGHLDRCYFTDSEDVGEVVFSKLLEKELVGNIYKILEIMPYSLRVELGIEKIGISAMQALRSFEESMEKFFEFANDEHIDFLYAHFSIPHPPFIYKAGEKRFVRGDDEQSDYFDNLKLVDDTVGEIRKYLEQKGEWDRSVVILTSDHWWRISKYFDGKTDHRVPFIVKMEKQGESITYDKEFNTVLVHDLVRALFENEILDPPALVKWLDSHRTMGDSPYNIDPFSI